MAGFRCHGIETEIYTQTDGDGALPGYGQSALGRRLMQAAAVEEIYRNLTRNLFAEGVGAAGIRLYLFTADEDFETVVGYRRSAPQIV